MTRTILVCSVFLAAAPASAEVFIDLGANLSRVESLFANRDNETSRSGSGVHFGIGARRNVTDRSDLGFRVEVDSIDSDLLLAVRALDYRFNISNKLAVTAFIGAARFDFATPAYGYYVGTGIQFKEILDSWDLSIDLRYGDKLARDNVLPTDPQGSRPDNFHDVQGVSIYLSHRF